MPAILALAVAIICVLITVVLLVQISDRRWNDRFEAERQATKVDEREEAAA